jgi:hypothetical protein
MKYALMVLAGLVSSPALAERKYQYTPPPLDHVPPGTPVLKPADRPFYNTPEYQPPPSDPPLNNHPARDRPIGDPCTSSNPC